MSTLTMATALATRDDAIAQLRKLNDTWSGKKMNASALRIEGSLLAIVDTADRALGASIKDAASAEHQRATGAVYTSVVSHADRTRDQIDFFGVKLSQLRSMDFLDAEDSRPVDVILSAGGRGSRMIDKLSTFDFEKANGYIPVKPAVTASVQPRNVAQAAIEAPLRTILVKSVKVSAIVKASNESLTDVPVIDGAVRESIAEAVGQRVDHAVFNGADDGDNILTGLLVDGTAVTYAVAGIGYDDLVDAVAAVETSGGIATGIFAHPKTAAAIKKVVDADRLSSLPELTSLPPLADGTDILAEGTVVVLDSDSVAIGIRTAFEVAGTDRMKEAFESDSTFLAGRQRIAGVHVANAARVQILTKAAA